MLKTDTTDSIILGGMGWESKIHIDILTFIYKILLKMEKKTKQWSIAVIHNDNTVIFYGI